MLIKPRVREPGGRSQAVGLPPALLFPATTAASPVTTHVTPSVITAVAVQFRHDGSSSSIIVMYTSATTDKNCQQHQEISVKCPSSGGGRPAWQTVGLGGRPAATGLYVRTSVTVYHRRTRPGPRCKELLPPKLLLCS